MFIVTKFASHHLYVVYMCQKSLNFTYAFKCYHQNVSGFTLAGPPCIFCHESWQNDICSFRSMNVALTPSFKLISF